MYQHIYGVQNKMKNITQYDVIELSNKELNSTNGGYLLRALAVLTMGTVSGAINITKSAVGTGISLMRGFFTNLFYC